MLPWRFLAVIWVLGSLIGCGDAPALPSRVAWLRDNAIRLRSIDPADERFDDLQAMKQVIGDARIVQLGEPSHGAGTTFDAKIRLIKFLHQEMGFDVLAFESGLYDCRRAWQSFRAGDGAQAAAEQGIFGVWTRSKQLEPLFAYIAASANSESPLELAGFDCQFSARGSKESLIPEIQERIIGSDPARLTPDEVASLTILLRWLGDPRAALDDEKRTAGLDALARLTDALDEIAAAAELPVREIAFWRQLLRSIRAYSVMARRYAEAGHTVDGNARDVQMAENLLWLAGEYYRGRKIIAWAATTHLQHNAQTIDRPDYDADYGEELVPMGQHVWTVLGEQTYTLGFVAYSGKAGRPGSQPRRIPPAPPGSLEALCNQAGLENAIIDFRGLPEGSWLREPLVSRPLGFAPMEASWPAVLDGVVFSRRMVPSSAR